MTARIINLAEFKAARDQRLADPFASFWALYFSFFWGMR